MASLFALFGHEVAYDTNIARALILRFCFIYDHHQLIFAFLSPYRQLHDTKHTGWKLEAARDSGYRNVSLRLTIVLEHDFLTIALSR